MGFNIECVHCGPRSYTEFSFGGEVPDESWPEFERVWLRINAEGVQRERWFHYAGCRRWLTLSRDTTTNEVLPL